jgi:hypothetical protein
LRLQPDTSPDHWTISKVKNPAFAGIMEFAASRFGAAKDAIEELSY